MAQLDPLELVIFLSLVVAGVAAVVLVVSFLVLRILVWRQGRKEADPNALRLPCPTCGEMILPQAKFCRFCGRELPEVWSRQAGPPG